MGNALNEHQRVAVELLELKRGSLVVNVGDGKGSDLDALHQAVGPEGTICVVEPQSDRLEDVQTHARRLGLRNVEFVTAGESPSSTAPGAAILFSCLPTAERLALDLDAVLALLAPGARVACYGRKWTSRWRLPVNAAVWLAARRNAVCVAGRDHPCRALEWRVEGFTVREAGLGGSYVAWGTLPVPHRASAWPSCSTRRVSPA